MSGAPRRRTCRRFKAKPENTDVYGRKLGSFQMDPAAGHQVHLSADPDESVAADAIYVVATPAPGPAAVFTWLPVVPTAGAYKIYANWPADASPPDRRHLHGDPRWRHDTGHRQPTPKRRPMAPPRQLHPRPRPKPRRRPRILQHGCGRRRRHPHRRRFGNPAKRRLHPRRPPRHPTKNDRPVGHSGVGSRGLAVRPDSEPHGYRRAAAPFPRPVLRRRNGFILQLLPRL